MCSSLGLAPWLVPSTLTFYFYKTLLFSKGFLPRFTRFWSFAPPLPWPKVATYVSIDFCSRYALLPGFYDVTQDAMHLDIHTPAGCFGISASKFRVSNIYTCVGPNHSRSVKPEVAFQQLDFPYIVAGDFNSHSPTTDPSRVFSYSEELASTPFHSRASDLCFRLLNTPGAYTRYPLSGTHGPGVIDMSFANPHMSPAFSAWDASTLPSTGSDHVPILITMSSPDDILLPRTPCWDLTDWEALRPRLDRFRTPPSPARLSLAQLDYGMPPP